MVAAPAMGIRVLEISDGQQRAPFFEHSYDDRVCCPHLFSFKGREHRVRPDFAIDVKMAGGIDAAGLVEVVTLTRVEVVCTVRGSGVDRARALIGSDIGGEHAKDAALEEGMFEGGVLERA